MAGVSADIDVAIQQCEENIDQFLEEFAAEFVQRVKDKTPVQTGKLQAGWESNINKDSIEVYNNVEYAEYVEEGTPFQSPQGMLRSTAEEADSIAREIEQRLKQ